MTTTDEPSAHALSNRAYWTTQAPRYAVAGAREWASPEPTWGIWMLDDEAAGMLGSAERWRDRDVVELGCGTAYVSSWLARMGARPVGIDITPAQLETARRLQVEHGVEFPLHEGTAESLPFDDDSFDMAISEYGACLWCDPYAWIPEAARVLRPGGELVFLTNSVVQVLCSPPDMPEDEPVVGTLGRPQNGLLRASWDDSPDAIEFHLPHGEMIALLRRCGFEVLELRELYAPADGSSTYGWASTEFATRWPTEEVWRARLSG